jgi:MFS transporter, OFA family, oxalate/formate antiporter
LKNNNVKIFYGWFVVGGLFWIAFLGPMGRYILTSLFPFILDDPGWSRQTIGIAFTIHLWVYAFFAIAVGHLIDRIGGRKIIFTGGVLILIGLVCLSQVQHIWQFYLVFGIILSAAVAMTHFVPNTTIVRKWFIKKSGIATGLVTIGTAAGLAVLPLVISRLCVSIDWRTTCLLCGFVIGVPIMLIAIFVIRDTPESMGLLSDGEETAENRCRSFSESANADTPGRLVKMTPRQAMRTKSFWYFFIVYSVTGIPLQGMLTHMVSWSIETGVSSANSGMIMLALGLPSILIRIFAGWMGDRFGKKKVLVFFNIISMTVWIFGWFFIKDVTSFFIFAILLGFAYSAPFALYTPFLGDLFGRLTLGTLMGTITLGHSIIGGIGPYLWGWIADTTGSYALNCIISAGCYGIVTIFLIMIYPVRHKESLTAASDSE